MQKKIFYSVFPKLTQARVATISFTSIIIFFAAWFALSYSGAVPEVILPGPLSVIKKLSDIWTNGFAGKPLYEHVGISLYRVFGSLILAALCAVPLGILVAINDYIKGIIDPFVEFYRPLPPLAYLPLVIIWFGVGETGKFILIFLAIFAPIFLNTRAGVENIPKERVNAAMSLGASKTQLIWHIILPSALHSILTGIRIGTGFGWTTLVAAEMVAANSGLGHMILSASEFLQTEVVVLGIFIIGFLALGTDYLLRRIIERYSHWSGK